ncbi:MAG: hypothetical protein L0H31_03700 [Nocardioidaceae bacterium]|nr:hypothetical protein [Nocardioidaceae bacterium]
MTDLAVPAWLAVVLIAVLLALGALVIVLAVTVRREQRRTEALLTQAADDADVLREQLAGIEEQLRAGRELADRAGEATVAFDHREYVITDIGERGPQVPARTVPAPQFADILVRESVIRTVSLAAGLRRALSPQVRHRIRFEMKREVRRSRKQRKQLLKQARREWQAQGRAEIEVGR